MQSNDFWLVYHILLSYFFSFWCCTYVSSEPTKKTSSLYSLITFASAPELFWAFEHGLVTGDYWPVLLVRTGTRNWRRSKPHERYSTPKESLYQTYQVGFSSLLLMRLDFSRSRCWSSKISPPSSIRADNFAAWSLVSPLKLWRE